MYEPTIDERFSSMRGALAAMHVAVQALLRSAPNRDVLRTTINDAIENFDAVNQFASSKFGADDEFRETYECALRAYRELL